MKFDLISANAGEFRRIAKRPANLKTKRALIVLNGLLQVSNPQDRYSGLQRRADFLGLIPDQGIRHRSAPGATPRTPSIRQRPAARGPPATTGAASRLAASAQAAPGVLRGA